MRADFFCGVCCVLIILREACCKWIFSLRETCILIFLFEKLILFMELVACWFCPWNLFYIDFSLNKTCRLICVLMKLIFILELISINFCSYNLLCCDFYTWNFSLVECSFREARTLIFLVVNLICSWNLLPTDFLSWNLPRADFLFVKLAACWFFWNLYIDFFFLTKLIFVHGTCSLLIFIHKIYCFLIYLLWDL